MSIFTKHKINPELFSYFSVLSNPIRYKVYVKILHEACECRIGENEHLTGNCVTELAKDLGINQPTVSNHVKELMNSGLVRAEKVGKKIFLFGTEESAKDLERFGEFVKEEVYGLPH